MSNSSLEPDAAQSLVLLFLLGNVSNCKEMSRKTGFIITDLTGLD